MSLLTEYPLWLIVLPLLLGVGYAFFLYYKNNNIVFEKKSRIIMASLRGLSMFLLAFLLLSPMIKMTLKKIDKPLILVAIDNSESIRSGKDSAFYNQTYPQQIKHLISSLGSAYDVETYLIGENDHLMGKQEALNVDFSDKSTNLSSIFDQVNTLYSNRNVGAMVLLSDGIYNIGSNPFYKVQEAKYPIYTVGLGSTEITTDLFIAGIDHNKQTLKGNFFPVEVKIAAHKLSGKTAELVVHEGNTELYRKSISLSGNRYFETVKFMIEAKDKGLHHYKVDLTELDGEITHKNNHGFFFVEVVESRDKIAILYNAPHPDIAAMKESLELTDNYDVEVFAAADFNKDPSEYSLFILHQLPSNTQPISNLLSQIRKNATPALYIVGTQTNLSVFNSLNTGLAITQNKALTNNAMPLYNDNFTSFTFSEEARSMFPLYPPIQTIFGTYKTSISANVFLYQKISGVDTRYPLVVFNDQNGVRTGVITGVGFWSWKLYNYVRADNHDAFNEYIEKMILYLASRGDRSRFRVHHETIYSENASIEFSAELFNESFELINEPDVKIVIKGSGDTTYEEQFSKQNNSYYLNIGELPVGTYTWTASTQSGQRLEKSGRFTVQPLMLETTNLVANHDLLKSISSATEGKFFSKKDINKVYEEIKNNEHIKPIASYQKKYTMLLNTPWYFVAIILLLGIEWFLRKWYGGY